MTDSEQPKTAAEPDDPLLQFFSYRGRISRPYYFLYLLIELGLLFIGMLFLAMAMNPTGSGGGGGGGGVLLLMLVVVAWFHSVAAVKRLRDVGMSVPAFVMFGGWPAIVLLAIAAALMGATGDARVTGFEDLIRIVIFITVMLWVTPGFLPTAAMAGEDQIK